MPHIKNLIQIWILKKGALHILVTPCWINVMHFLLLFIWKDVLTSVVKRCSSFCFGSSSSILGSKNSSQGFSRGACGGLNQVKNKSVNLFIIVWPFTSPKISLTKKHVDTKMNIYIRTASGFLRFFVFWRFTTNSSLTIELGQDVKFHLAGSTHFFNYFSFCQEYRVCFTSSNIFCPIGRRIHFLNWLFRPTHSTTELSALFLLMSLKHKALETTKSNVFRHLYDLISGIRHKIRPRFPHTFLFILHISERNYTMLGRTVRRAVRGHQRRFLNIHEYQAHELLQQYQCPVVNGRVANSTAIALNWYFIFCFSFICEIIAKSKTFFFGNWCGF